MKSKMTEESGPRMVVFVCMGLCMMMKRSLNVLMQIGNFSQLAISSRGFSVILLFLSFIIIFHHLLLLLRCVVLYFFSVSVCVLITKVGGLIMTRSCHPNLIAAGN